MFIEQGAQWFVASSYPCLANKLSNVCIPYGCGSLCQLWLEPYFSFMAYFVLPLECACVLSSPSKRDYSATKRLSIANKWAWSKMAAAHGDGTSSAASSRAQQTQLLTPRQWYDPSSLPLGTSASSGGLPVPVPVPVPAALPPTLRAG